MFKNKIKASLIHLSLSVVVVSFLMLVIIYFWFPFSYLQLTDFKEIVKLIIAIDLVLGPILTFVIFNPKKKSLIFDLSVVAMIQVSALTYGVYALYQVHPLYITFAKNGFTLITARDAQPQNAKHEEYKISKLSSGKFAYAGFPKDEDKIKEIITDILFGSGVEIKHRIEHYKPYDAHINDIVAKSLDPTTIFSDEETKEKVYSFLKEYKNDLDKFAYLPLDGAIKDAIIVIDKKTAKPITNLNIDPWKYVKRK